MKVRTGQIEQEAACMRRIPTPPLARVGASCASCALMDDGDEGAPPRS